MKFSAILKVLLAGMMLVSFAACDKTAEQSVEVADEATIMLDVDKVSLQTASVRIRHNGTSDMLWVYMLTQDLESAARPLLEEKIAADLQLAGELVVYSGQNKSIHLTGLIAKSYYRFLCASIDPKTGEIMGEVAELQFRTRRDPDVFELNENWTISQGDRVINPEDKMEYDNFICSSTDDESYVMMTIRDIDFKDSYQNSIRALFEDYVSYFGLQEGDSKWKDIVKSGKSTWSEQRLRSGEWIIFMIGLDQEGEITGLYQRAGLTVEQEAASEEYNRWIGAWTVSDKNGAELFDIQIIPSENNMWYYMGGWESTNIYGFDTFDPALMPELFFDKATGKICFVSQYVNTMITDTDSIDFYFSGTFTYGNTYVLGDEVLNLRMAESAFINEDYSAAMITSLNFVNSGVAFPIESICYMYYNGSQPNAISLSVPVLPLNMTKKAE